MGGLLDHEGIETGRVGGQRRRHAAAAGSDDEHVDRFVERLPGGLCTGVRGHAAIPTAVLIANPAINSGAAR